MTVADGEGSRTIGIAAALAALLIWSGFILTTRYGLRGPVQPSDMLMLRFGISGLILLPVFVMRGFAGLRAWQVLVMALLGGLLYSSLSFVGFGLAPAAHAGVLLHGMLPFFTAILGALFLAERLRGLRILGLGLIFCGIAALGISSLTDDAGSLWLGDLGFLGASLSWSVFTVLMRRWNLSAIDATMLICVPSMVIYTPIYLAFLPVGLGEMSWGWIAFYGIYQGVLAVVVSIVAFGTAVRHIGATAATSVIAGVPAIATVAAIPLLDEVPTPVTAIGVGLAICGMLVSVHAVRRGPAVSLRYGK
ncbi:DMT family transporter [Marinibaculum pumilum]|uniref:DMT family transporter n=1 Tax=Marinibaculum pumilum TaxID=1766165 RepID=A0ABV7L8G0_9PROT